MTTQQWLWSGVVVLAIMGGLAWFGLTPFLHENVIDQTSTTVQQIGAPTTGSSFNTAKIAAINMAPSSTSATSTSILNTDANDRIVTDAVISCSGVGTADTAVANLVLTAGTTTTSGINLGSSALYVANMIVATSTGNAYTATSTYTNVFARRWNTGTYLTFQFNATSTGICNVGAHYLAL